MSISCHRGAWGAPRFGPISGVRFLGTRMPPPIVAAGDFGISYRPFTTEDLPFVAELYASTRRWETALTGWPVEAQEAFLAQQHEAQHSHYSIHYADGEWLIVEREGQAIGRLYMHEDPEDLRII